MDAGAALFLFLAAVVVGGIWADSRKESERQETLRRLLDKGEKLDEAQIRELLQPLRHHHGHGHRHWGAGGIDAARGFHIAGTLSIFAGVAGMLVCWLLYGLSEEKPFLFGLVIGLGVVVFGLGFFVCARLVRRKDDEPEPASYRPGRFRD
jgi:hypothetical protein